MSPDLYDLLNFVWIAIIAAQWVGTIALRKAGRTPAWWCLFIGVVLMSLALVAEFITIPYLRNLNVSGGLSSEIRSIAAMLSALGFLTFAIGFALHCLRVASLSNRLLELETMNLVQAKELERLRNR